MPGFIYFSSCAPSLFVKPLGKGEKAINTSLGGPLIKFAGKAIPLPFATVTAGYGLTKSLTVFGNIQPTSLIFGVFQTELGGVKNIYYNPAMNLGFSISPAINLAIDKWEYNFKLWPRLDFSAYWDFNKHKNNFYLGASNWFELSKTKGYGEQQVKHWLFNPQVGYSIVRRRWNFNIEAKALAPGITRYPKVIDYVSIGNMGALGVYAGFTRRF